MPIQLTQQGLLHLLSHAQLLESTSDALLLSQMGQLVLIGHCDNHCEVLRGVTVEEELNEEASLHVDAFHLIWCHVLSLLEFEDVLFAVDNLERKTLWDELGNITSPQPPIFSDGFRRHLIQFIVTLEDLRTSDLYFSPGSGPSLLVYILGSVAHFRKIGQSDFSSLLHSHIITPI